jgi:hypothetical protein
MFHRAVAYFTEASEGCSLSTDTGLELYNRRLLEELVHALEVARSRLAVTVAAENKRILPHQRNLYAETDARARSFLKGLRSCRRPGRPGAVTWAQGLESLRRFVAEDMATNGGSLHLCSRLRDILQLLDGKPEETTSRPSERRPFGND